MTVVTKSELLLVCAISGNHLAQFVLLCELAGQSLEVGNEGLASGNQSLLGGDIAVGLDPELKSCEEWVGNCATTRLARDYVTA